MLFPSTVFLFLFLPIVLALYFISPKKLQNVILLIASLFFYAWGEPIYIVAIIGLAFFNFVMGWVIGIGKKSLVWLILAIILDVGTLVYFKYLIFFLTIFTKFFTRFGLVVPIPEHISLPLGISFITFHIISYIIDIYKKRTPAEKSVFDFALYIFLFPHLIAGPIVRYIDIGPQIKKRVVSKELFVEGIIRFITGLAKKVIIADTLAKVADKIFVIYPQYLSTEMVWLAIICYSLQIYFDFSGYSDMAIGLAKMFGFTFNENFNFPYISKSIREFWRRWHMTLYNWFRDYVYIPLGGNRKGRIRTAINILIVFTLTGLWHGANWNFIIWGLYYGVILVLENFLLGKWIEKLWIPLQHIYALLLITVGWLFFRIESVRYAFYLLKVLFGINPNHLNVYPLSTFLDVETLTILIVAIIISTSLPHIIFNKLKEYKKDFIEKNLVGFSIFSLGQMVFLTFLFLYSIMNLASNTYNPFIYFRF